MLINFSITALECEDKVDLLVIMDDSAKVGEKKFSQMKDMVKTLLELFTISAERTSISLMTYNSKPSIHVKLPQLSTNIPQTLEKLTKELENIRFSGDASSKLADALAMAGAQVFPERLKSRDSKKVMITCFISFFKWRTLGKLKIEY